MISYILIAWLAGAVSLFSLTQVLAEIPDQKPAQPTEPARPRDLAKVAILWPLLALAGIVCAFVLLARPAKKKGGQP